MAATDADPKDTRDSFIMVRTVCCEGYKQFGQRCQICPNRPENRQAAREYKENKLPRFARCGISHPSAVFTGGQGVDLSTLLTS
jgi:hypothetical protein